MILNFLSITKIVCWGVNEVVSMRIVDIYDSWLRFLLSRNIKLELKDPPWRSQRPLVSSKLLLHIKSWVEKQIMNRERSQNDEKECEVVQSDNSSNMTFLISPRETNKVKFPEYEQRLFFAWTHEDSYHSCNSKSKKQQSSDCNDAGQIYSFLSCCKHFWIRVLLHIKEILNLRFLKCVFCSHWTYFIISTFLALSLVVDVVCGAWNTLVSLTSNSSEWTVFAGWLKIVVEVFIKFLVCLARLTFSQPWDNFTSWTHWAGTSFKIRKTSTFLFR